MSSYPLLWYFAEEFKLSDGSVCYFYDDDFQMNCISYDSELIPVICFSEHPNCLHKDHIKKIEMENPDFYSFLSVLATRTATAIRQEDDDEDPSSSIACFATSTFTEVRGESTDED